VGIGAACGLVSAFLLMRLLSTLLFGVSTSDPMTYIVTVMLLMAIAAVASYLPSRRATAIDPAIALRLD